MGSIAIVSLQTDFKYPFHVSSSIYGNLQENNYHLIIMQSVGLPSTYRIH